MYEPGEAEGERELDGRSDVYSLAAVLFEMLMGEPLFSGLAVQSIMAKRAGGVAICGVGCRARRPP